MLKQLKILLARLSPRRMVVSAVLLGALSPTALALYFWFHAHLPFWFRVLGWKSVYNLLGIGDVTAGHHYAVGFELKIYPGTRSPAVDRYFTTLWSRGLTEACKAEPLSQLSFQELSCVLLVSYDYLDNYVGTFPFSKTYQRYFTAIDKLQASEQLEREVVIEILGASDVDKVDRFAILLAATGNSLDEKISLVKACCSAKDKSMAARVLHDLEGQVGGVDLACLKSKLLWLDRKASAVIEQLTPHTTQLAAPYILLLAEALSMKTDESCLRKSLVLMSQLPAVSSARITQEVRIRRYLGLPYMKWFIAGIPQATDTSRYFKEMERELKKRRIIGCR